MSQDVINAHLDNNCQPIIIQAGSNGLVSPKKNKKQKQEWSRLFGSDSPTVSTLSKGKHTKKYVLCLPEGGLACSFVTYRHTGNEDQISYEPIPKMAYDTLTAKTIRERLAEYSLPTEGEKPVLVLRHQR
jgi:E3 ubiquitin-protein ligase RAD18